MKQRLAHALLVCVITASKLAEQITTSALLIFWLTSNLAELGDDVEAQNSKKMISRVGGAASPPNQASPRSYESLLRKRTLDDNCGSLKTSTAAESLLVSAMTQ